LTFILERILPKYSNWKKCYPKRLKLEKLSRKLHEFRIKVPDMATLASILKLKVKGSNQLMMPFA
jgi:hypothetical protein